MREALNAGRIEVTDAVTGRQLSVRDLDSHGGLLDINIRNKNGPWFGAKTIFPKQWTDEQIIENVNEAYRNIMRDKAHFNVGRNRYDFTLENGIEIRITLDADDKIISAYPLHLP